MGACHCRAVLRIPHHAVNAKPGGTMYELVEEDDRLLVVKYEERFGRQAKVFALAIHDKAGALEVLAALNARDEE